MRRRDFLMAGTAGAVSAGFVGCMSGAVPVRKELTQVDFETKVPKPIGNMPTAEIGKIGIKVSKFGFGSHIREDIVKYGKEREWMVREAFDLGINFFDVYDYEQQCFQYEPMGRYLAPIIKDTVISITLWPYEGRTVEQELERDLRLFGRDFIDCVRIHAWKNSRDEAVVKKQLGHRWEWWETLFRLKEKGYIRAVGVPVHTRNDLKEPIEQLSLDFVIVPFNFYHNWTWTPRESDDFKPLMPNLKERGIGIITMKPFAGDFLVMPFKKLATEYDTTGSVNFAQACLRYIINSGLPVDSTLGGMYNPYHLHENVAAYFNPAMSEAEREVLMKIRNRARVIARNHLPARYRFLEEWVPDSWDDSDLKNVV